MNIEQAARELGVSRKLIYSLIDRGKLRAIRNPLYIHGPVKIPREDVDRLKTELAS